MPIARPQTDKILDRRRLAVFEQAVDAAARVEDPAARQLAYKTLQEQETPFLTPRADRTLGFLHTLSLVAMVAAIPLLSPLTLAGGVCLLAGIVGVQTAATRPVRKAYAVLQDKIAQDTARADFDAMWASPRFDEVVTAYPVLKDSFAEKAMRRVLDDACVRPETKKLADFARRHGRRPD